MTTSLRRHYPHQVPLAASKPTRRAGVSSISPALTRRGAGSEDSQPSDVALEGVPFGVGSPVTTQSVLLFGGVAV